MRRAVADAATALASTREAVQDARLPAGRLPDEVRAVDRPSAAESVVLRVSRDGEARAIARPSASLVDIVPADLDEAKQAAESARSGATDRQALAARRLDEARRLAKKEEAVARLAAEADRLAGAAESDAQAADDRAAERDAAAAELAHAWRAWATDPAAADLLGSPNWAAHRLIGPLLLDANALAGERTDPLGDLDEIAEIAARPARAADRGRTGSARRRRTQ